MFKIELQLEPQRKALYEEAIRRMHGVCVCADSNPDGCIIGPKDALSDPTVPYLLDQPEKMGEETLASLIQGGRNAMPAHEWRFRPKIQPIQAALRDKKLGKPGLMRLHDWTSEAIPVKQRLFGPMDLACWFFEGDPILCHTVESKDSVLCHLKFASDGMALMDVSNCSDSASAYESIQLIGATGAAYGDDHHNTHLQFNHGSVSARIHHQGIVHGLMGLVDAFVSGVTDQSEWCVSLNDTLRVYELMKEVANG